MAKIPVDITVQPSESPSEILKYFVYRHLPARQAAISKVFSEIAWQMEEMLVPSRQKQMALEHLLIAKDAAVRSSLTERDLEKGRRS